MDAPWPALEHGTGALPRAAVHWRNYSVITTPSPWRLAEPSLAGARSVAFATDLNRGTLEALRQTIAGSELIVGLGSGIAMDTAKYLSKAEQTPLAQVLSTSSNNACF